MSLLSAAVEHLPEKPAEKSYSSISCLEKTVASLGVYSSLNGFFWVVLLPISKQGRTPEVPQKWHLQVFPGPQNALSLLPDLDE